MRLISNNSFGLSGTVQKIDHDLTVMDLTARYDEMPWASAFIDNGVNFTCAAAA